MSLNLVRYDEVSEEKYVDYISEWETHKEKVIPSATCRDGRSFSEMMNKWREDETDIPVSNGFVPATLYFLTDEAEEFLWDLFRHYLTSSCVKLAGTLDMALGRVNARKDMLVKCSNYFLKR